MTAEIIDAPTAEQWGLVDQMAASGQAIQTALEMAATTAAGAPLAHTFTKQTLSRLPLSSEELLAAEADAQSLLFGTSDFAEGRDAFLDKRKPNFPGE